MRTPLCVAELGRDRVIHRQPITMAAMDIAGRGDGAAIQGHTGAADTMVSGPQW